MEGHPGILGELLLLDFGLDERPVASKLCGKGGIAQRTVSLHIFANCIGLGVPTMRMM